MKDKIKTDAAVYDFAALVVERSREGMAAVQGDKPAAAALVIGEILAYATMFLSERFRDGPEPQQ